MLEQKEQENSALSANNKSLEKQIDSCKTQTNKLRSEIEALTKQKEATSKKLAEFEAECKQMNDNYLQLKSQSTKQVRELIDNLEAAQEKLLKTQQSLDMANADLALREARLKEVEAALRERDEVMNRLKTKIADALFGFRDKGFSVEIKDGKVYVSLSNQLLFESASTKIDKKGQEALKELGKVLKEQTDINILVEGHTDNMKVTNMGQIKDNWDLSVIRSTEVIRVLTGEGVDPIRITGSGRGEYFPVDAAETPEARSKNRRTEIILTPKLDELYQLLKN